jgi:membrane peptidoglycan carboxypeptidase
VGDGDRLRRFCQRRLPHPALHRAEIQDDKKQVLAKAEPITAGDDSLRAIDPRNAYLMDSMLRDVTIYGTAARASATLKRRDLAGKTGTTNDHVDAWFCGYQQTVVGCSWIGFDQPRNLGRGETGGTAALPAWIAYMAKRSRTFRNRSCRRPRVSSPYPPRAAAARARPRKCSIRKTPPPNSRAGAAVRQLLLVEPALQAIEQQGPERVVTAAGVAAGENHDGCERHGELPSPTQAVDLRREISPPSASCSSSCSGILPSACVAHDRQGSKARMATSMWLSSPSLSSRPLR